MGSSVDAIPASACIAFIFLHVLVTQIPLHSLQLQCGWPTLAARTEPSRNDCSRGVKNWSRPAPGGSRVLRLAAAASTDNLSFYRQDSRKTRPVQACQRLKPDVNRATVTDGGRGETLGLDLCISTLSCEEHPKLGDVWTFLQSVVFKNWI